MAIGPPVNMFQPFIIPRMSLDLAKMKNTDIIPGMHLDCKGLKLKYRYCQKIVKYRGTSTTKVPTVLVPRKYRGTAPRMAVPMRQTLERKNRKTC